MSTHLSAKSATHSHFLSAVNATRGDNEATSVTPGVYKQVVEYNHWRASFTFQNQGTESISVRLDSVQGQPRFIVNPSESLILTVASAISVACSAISACPYAWLEETVRRG